MRKKKFLIGGLFLLLCINLFFVLAGGQFMNPAFTLTMEVEASAPQTIQISYTTVEDVNADTLKFHDFSYRSAGKRQTLRVKVPYNVRKIRVDFGDVINENAVIYAMSLSVYDETLDMTSLLDQPLMVHHMDKQDDAYRLEDTDPYILYGVDGNETYTFWKYTWTKRLIVGIAFALLFDLIMAVAAFFMLRNKEVRSLIANWRTIWNLAKRDFKTKYAGSYLGIFWAFVQPIVTILLYWFVFEVGFRSAPANGFPFVLWLISGLVPWFMFSDGLTAVTNCLLEYSYLVKKMVFDIRMLPVVKIISALFVHLFFICFTTLIFALNGYGVNLYFFQVFYYLFAMLVLIFAIGLLTCSVVVFFRDLGQIVQIFLQIGVWMTPIMWNISMIGPKLQFLFRLNPIYYLTDGYRDCLINHIWFWEKPGLTIYYWIVVAVLLALGTKVFKKLKVHFADVL